MKIFYYTPFYLPQSQAAAVRSYWLIQSLKNAGHEVTIYCSIKTKDSKKLTLNPADNQQRFLKRLICEIACGIEVFLKILFSRYDRYILSSPPFITIYIAHWACRIRRKEYILDIRDIYPEGYFAQGLIKEHSLVGRTVKFFTKKMYEHSRGIVSVTPGLVEKIQRLAPKSNVELLINGFDKEIFQASEVKNDKFTVMFHGNMGRVQNISTILNVAKYLEHNPEIQFVFIGEGPQSELIKNSPLKNVSYLGPKSYQEIPTIISHAHLGFSARRDDDIGSDAFPVKVFEYIGVGIPTIMTPKSGIMTGFAPEAIFEYGNHEVEAIATKILQLKDSHILIKNNDELSRQVVSKKILNLL